MTHLVFTNNIIPLADFKARASEVLNAQKEHKEPVVITQNGKAAAVLVPPEEFDDLVRRATLIEAVKRGLDDANGSRLTDQVEFAAELAERYSER